MQRIWEGLASCAPLASEVQSLEQDRMWWVSKMQAVYTVFMMQRAKWEVECSVIGYLSTGALSTRQVIRAPSLGKQVVFSLWNFLHSFR